MPVSGGVLVVLVRQVEQRRAVDCYHYTRLCASRQCELTTSSRTERAESRGGWTIRCLLLVPVGREAMSEAR